MNTKIRLWGLIKIGDFLDQMNNCDLFKKDPELWSWLGVRMLYVIESDCVAFDVLHRTGWGKNGSL